jgi:FtsP/CotA-like multicopper oxidase with cupredoxin domain
VIVEMNQSPGNYFLRAVTQTGCPSGCVNTGLGSANGIIQYDGTPLALPTSDFGNKTIADFAFCADEPIASLVPFLEKGAGSLDAFQASASTLPAGNVANVATADDGVVFRWFLNNGALKVDYEQPTLLSLAQGAVSNTSISNPIILNQRGKWYYFIIQNQFFASHPMHLHGHDFSVLGQGTTSWNPSLVSTLNFDNPNRRDTAMLVGSAGPGAPPGYTVIGFQSDNPGAWLMHCHIVWHVDGGLAMQWIERPDDIHAQQYTSKDAFQRECKNVKSYFAGGGQKVSSGESGLKVRSYFDDMLAARGGENVVRRGDGAAKRRYIDQHLKRGHHF